MPDAPSNFPDFALQDVLNSAGSVNKERPEDRLRQQGYDALESPKGNHFNWMFNNIDGWIKHLKQAVDETLSVTYPIGSVYITTSDTNIGGAGTTGGIFSFGTWERISEGRVLLGAGQSSVDVNGDTVNLANGNTGGEYNHTLVTSEIPSHQHNVLMESKTVNTDPDAPDQSETWFGDTRNNVGSAENASTTFINRSSPTGGDQPHNNIQPYLVVNIYRRTA